MIPDLGPLKDLCVVDVTTCEYSKGSSATFAATKPEMCAMSRIFSTRAPSMPFGLKSHKIKWLSVPPEDKLYPNSVSFFAKALQFEHTCFWYSLNSGVFATFNATAKAPMVWLCGPPCNPGKTAELIACSNSFW